MPGVGLPLEAFGEAVPAGGVVHGAFALAVGDFVGEVHADVAGGDAAHRQADVVVGGGEGGEGGVDD